MIRRSALGRRAEPESHVDQWIGDGLETYLEQAGPLHRVPGLEGDTGRHTHRAVGGLAVGVRRPRHGACDLLGSSNVVSVVQLDLVDEPMLLFIRGGGLAQACDVHQGCAAAGVDYGVARLPANETFPDTPP